jgi:hypothetical protein
MSPSAASGTMPTVRPSWKPLITQIDAAAVALTSCAIVGSAVLAIV